MIKTCKTSFSGCGLIRNGVKGAWPFFECLLQVLPICDEYVINVDTNSEDNTLELAYKIADAYPKVRVFESQWDLGIGPYVLSVETDKVFAQCRSDWVIYNQADECFTTESVQLINDIVDDLDTNALLINRVQLKLNFQEMHGHPCCTVRPFKNNMASSVGDAMTLKIVDDNFRFLSDFGKTSPIIPTGEEIHVFDCTRIWPSQFPGKFDSHAQVWWQNCDRNKGGSWGLTPEEWAVRVQEWEDSGYPEIYLRKESPFPIPEILKPLVGIPAYHIRPELFEIESLK